MAEGRAVEHTQLLGSAAPCPGQPRARVMDLSYDTTCSGAFHIHGNWDRLLLREDMFDCK